MSLGKLCGLASPWKKSVAGSSFGLHFSRFCHDGGVGMAFGCRFWLLF